MLYSIILPLHSIVRWLVILSAVAVVGRAFYAWLSKKEWIPLDNRLGMLYPMMMDIQLLIGLILYFFASPLTAKFLQNIGGAMQDPNLRFFGFEHVFYMILALGIAHAGRSLSRKAKDAAGKHRAAALLFGLSVVVVMFAIPWSRPLI
jgi:hypothetical protein